MGFQRRLSEAYEVVLLLRQPTNVPTLGDWPGWIGHVDKHMHNDEIMRATCAHAGVPAYIYLLLWKIAVLERTSWLIARRCPFSGLFEDGRSTISFISALWPLVDSPASLCAPVPCLLSFAEFGPQLVGRGEMALPLSDAVDAHVPVAYCRTCSKGSVSA
jgi:hypothetical protein